MRLALVVVQGVDLGARLVADAQVRIVGRARAADLPLTDLAISRRHLEVCAFGSTVKVRVCAGAAPFVRDQQQQQAADLRAGERLVVGNTVLDVVEVEAAAADARHEVTSARTLLGGLAADVRGLAAVYELSEALDGVDARDAAASVLQGWAGRHVGAAGAELLLADEVRARGDLVPALAQAPSLHDAAGPDGAGVVITVIADPADPAALVVRFAGASVSDDARRIVAVAGRICAGAANRFRRMAALELERADLRRAAVGGATSFLGDSAEAKRIASLVPRLAASDAVALLLGESGTGKTFLARLIHEAGPRAPEPLRILNCAAIPEGLIEAELFGHERGAFTGAIAARAGAFEAAGRGTILLDEVGELAPTSQAKLLRVLEEKRFERIGSNRSIPVACRVLAATNRDLGAMVEAGQFRSDLFFRLSVVTVRLPPLSERGEDVVALARQLLSDLASGAGRRVEGFADEAVSSIRRYGWPGNVRELRNAIEHALVLGDGPRIQRADLPETVRGAAPSIEGHGDGEEETTVRLPANLEWLEARAIEAALKATGGNRTRAAALLGINRVTLYKKIRGG